MRHVFPFVVATAILGGVSLLAQDDSASPTAPLTDVASIRSLGTKRLNVGEPVHLRGTVVFVGQTGFTLHDGTFGIQIKQDEAVTPPPVGADVIVGGVTGTNRPGDQIYPLVIARKIVQVNLASPPLPIETSIRDLATFRHWDQFVTVEGFVLDHSWSDDEHHLLLGAHDGWAVIHVRNSPKESFSRDLLGARVRARGVNQGHDHSPMNAMRVASPEHLQILTLGTGDPFSIPLTPVAKIAGAEASTLPPVKVRGFVLQVSPQNHLYVREESGTAFRIAIFTPLEKPDTQKGLSSTVAPFGGVKPGVEIEAVGIVADTGTDVGLRFCQVRVITPEAKAPTAISTTISAVFDGHATNQVVTLGGRLVEQQTIDLGGGSFRSVLLLEDDTKILRCQLDSTESDPYRSFRRDDLIEVTGLIPGSPDREPLYLILSKKDDAVSRGLSRDALFRRVWIWGGIAAIILILLAIWVDSLRRSLARTAAAESAVRDLNATLEDRVGERTADLESARAELDRALGQERELNALKSRFVAMVSHEFRTPLGVTMSALELLRHHRSRLDQEKQGELLEDIFSATLRMSGLMEQILILGRAESGKMGFQPAPLDLPAIARRLTEETLAASDRENPVNFVFEGDLAPVNLDESLLRLILGNLLSNAVKYSPPQGTIRVEATREGETLALVIGDEGIGIPAEDQAHLFEAFHRATNVGEISGTGLGLLLVKRCVEIHQGTIRFTSEEGRGTTFYVTLPTSSVD